MTPHLLKPQLGVNKSFSIRKNIVPYFYNNWHYHKELELVHIIQGTGTQFIGDDIDRFEPGDMILAGSNLTHMWRCDEPYFRRNSRLKAIASVIHFLPDVFGQKFLDLPENDHLEKLFDKAKLGIIIKGDTYTKLSALIEAMFEQTDSERMISLLSILHIIAHSNETHTICRTPYILNNEIDESNKIDTIYQYVFKNFRNEISVDTAASLVHISPKSFSRFFKGRTRKNFSTLVLEVRINHACKLLQDKNLTISDICYESGFNNHSNFHRYFRQIMKMTPLQYAKLQENEKSD